MPTLFAWTRVEASTYLVMEPASGPAGVAKILAAGESRNRGPRRHAGRSRCKPHIVDELVRHGGETVYRCVFHPNGLPETEYRKVA